MNDKLKKPKEWIPLTEEEIGDIYKAGWTNNMEFARAIEAKLKEKNTAKKNRSIGVEKD